MFSGGVFEVNFLAVSQIEPIAWELIRSELQGIALMRTEDDFRIADRPFLRFHPTLAIASADSTLAEKLETRQRYVQVYLDFMNALEQCLSGSQSRAALEALDREEMNYRTAVRWAIADGRQEIAARLGLHVRRVFAKVRSPPRARCLGRNAPERGDPGRLYRAAAGYEREHAWTLLARGDPQGAVDKLQALIERLRETTEFDPAFQLANATATLGRVLSLRGHLPNPCRSCGKQLAFTNNWSNVPAASRGKLFWKPRITPMPRRNWATSPPRWAASPMR